MKFVYFISILIFISVNIYGQEEQNNFLLGGDFNFSSSRFNNPNNSSNAITSINIKNQFFSTQLNFGRVLGSKSILGLFGSYSIRNTNEVQTQNSGTSLIFDRKDEIYQGGIFLRKQLFSVSDVKFYLQPMLSYSDRKALFFSNTEPIHVNSFLLELDAGVFYTLNRKWNLLLSLSIFEVFKSLTLTNTTTTEFESDTIGFSSSLQLSNIRIGVERLF